MNEREFQALIQEVLDGEATAEQRERVEAYLAGSERGRARMRELEGVFQALGKVRAVPAPADLKDRVLRAIQARPSTARAPRIRALRLAYVFAAGLAAGVVGMGAWTGKLSPRAPAGEPPVSGTMMPARPPSTVAVRRAWQAGESRVEAVGWRVADVSLVGLQVTGDEALEVELRFDPRRLEAGAVRQSRPVAAHFEVEPGRVLIRTQARSEYIVEFRGTPSGAPIQVSLRSSSGSAAGTLPAPTER